MNFQDYSVFKSEPTYFLNNLFDHTGMAKWRIAERSIQDNMLVFCLGGKGCYRIADVSYEVKKGRILFISHHVPHSAVQWDDHNPVQVISVRLSIGTDSFSPFHLCYDCSNFDGYYAILQLLIKYFQRYKGRVPGRNAALLLSSFFQLLAMDLDFYSNHECFDEKMESASRLIESRLTGGLPISLQDLLEETQLSKYSFGKRFFASFHMTFKQYLCLKRLHYARRLLQQTQLSIQEIADTVGYSDPGIFSNQYKKFFHITPNNDRY